MSEFKGCKHLAVIMTGLISAEPACCYSAAKQTTNALNSRRINVPV